MLDFKQYRVLMFDCYGTLIDWETGILNALRPVLKKHNIQVTDNDILDLYSQLESEAEACEYCNYKDIQKLVVKGIGEETGFTPKPGELLALQKSVGKWLPFADSVKSLKRLKKRYKLAVFSNIDDDLIQKSIARLEVKFDWVITAEQLRSYKPSEKSFRQAIKKIGQPKKKILHVAQSIFHDIVPANNIGLDTVWVNRRKHLEGFGATPAAHARPDMEVQDLKALVNLAGIKK